MGPWSASATGVVRQATRVTPADRNAIAGHRWEQRDSEQAPKSPPYAQFVNGVHQPALVVAGRAAHGFRCGFLLQPVA